MNTKYEKVKRLSQCAQRLPVTFHQVWQHLPQSFIDESDGTQNYWQDRWIRNEFAIEALPMQSFDNVFVIGFLF